MSKNKTKMDIVQNIGKIQTVDKALGLLEKKTDRLNFDKIKQVTRPEVLIKIANAVAMCKPEKVFVNTGSDQDVEFIRKLALEKKEEAPLPIKGHTIHYDLAEEQGRIIDRTFYIVDEDETVSVLANKIIRNDALVEVEEKMSGIMEGMVMMVGFYMRGPIGSPVSNPALEITSSAYVSHSAELLYRNAFSDFDKEVSRLGHFFSNIHSEGLNRPEDLPNARVFMDRRQRTTYSMYCTYAGNTLLLKKGNHRFAVDKAVYEGCGKELAEHMFITGIKGKNDRVTWVAGAAPSGCGKTTTAMAGDLFVGDDLAQMWIEEDGSIRSINPECGIFGILEDVNREGDPVLMDVLRQPGSEVIWSNVLIDEQGVPHWTGNGEEPPKKGKNFQGEWYQGKKDKNGKDILISHPNARCTLNSKVLANYSPQTEDPRGVETRVFTYSGRDSDTMPPVRATKDPDIGVLIGASIVSEATATEVGAKGVRRQPWANQPFIPGALGDYMDCQFKFFNNKAIPKDKKPVMAGLNYFLTHKARGGESKKLLGEKKDVKVWLAWLVRLAHDEVDVVQTPIGDIPRFDDLKGLFKTLINKDYTKTLYEKQFSLYIDNILAGIDMQNDAYGKDRGIPAKFFKLLQRQKEHLIKIKEKAGPVVLPQQLEDIY